MAQWATLRAHVMILQRLPIGLTNFGQRGQRRRRCILVCCLARGWLLTWYEFLLHLIWIIQRLSFHCQISWFFHCLLIINNIFIRVHALRFHFVIIYSWGGLNIHVWSRSIVIVLNLIYVILGRNSWLRQIFLLVIFFDFVDINLLMISCWYRFQFILGLHLRYRHQVNTATLQFMLVLFPFLAVQRNVNVQFGVDTALIHISGGLLRLLRTIV